MIKLFPGAGGDGSQISVSGSGDLESEPSGVYLQQVRLSDSPVPDTDISPRSDVLMVPAALHGAGDEGGGGGPDLDGLLSGVPQHALIEVRGAQLVPLPARC